MSKKQLRYLLHGNPDKYEDIQSDLYITPEDSSSLWQKIGRQLLQRKGESWRLIDPIWHNLSKLKREKLGVATLDPEKVIELIYELGPEAINGKELTKKERVVLLEKLSQKQTYKKLWCQLKIHETTKGELVRIEEGRVYLENTDFPLDERLQEEIVLIRKNNDLRQEWIPQWTAISAIKTILSLREPDQYYDLILDSLARMSDEEKKQHKTNLHKTKWLPSKIAPIAVLTLPEKLTQHQKTIASLNAAKHPENSLPKEVSNHQVYSWLRKELFDHWKCQTVVKKILEYPSTTTANSKSQEFSLIILDAIDQTLLEEFGDEIKTTKWLVLKNKQLISPDQVIGKIPLKIKEYLPQLVKASHSDYIDCNEIIERITNHEQFKQIKKIFSQWNENDIFELVLKQPQPHQYLELILNALDSLLTKESSPNQVNCDRLKSTPWLLDNQDNPIAPNTVIFYPKLEEEIEELLKSTKCRYISISYLNQVVSEHFPNSYKWITENLFVSDDQALDQIGELLQENKDYHLGKFETTKFPLNELRTVGEQLDLMFLPSWNFLKKISIKKLRQFLLPRLLHSIDYNNLYQLFKTLSDSNKSPSEEVIKVFNSYLKLVCFKTEFQTNILPNICLLNREKQWKPSKELTWGEPSNISKSYFLDEDQELILQNYLNSLPRTDLSSLEEEQYTTKASKSEILNSYFQPWVDFCSPQFIGIFLSLLCGEDESVEALAEYYLGNRNIKLVQEQLVGKCKIKDFSIQVKKEGDDSQIVTSIIGSNFKAKLISYQEVSKIRNLFAYQVDESRQIVLITIYPKIEDGIRFNLSRLLFNSTKVILQKVYHKYPGDEEFQETWNQLGDSDQLEIDVAKTIILKNAPSLLQTLGVHKENSEINTQLKQIDQLQHQLVEFQHQKIDSKKIEIEATIDSHYFKLGDLLEERYSDNHNKISENLLKAIRKTIQKHGYRYQNIPCELFQNADDAVVEWRTMTPQKTLDNNRKQFIVVQNRQHLYFIHAGRPIGCFRHYEVPEKEYRDQGYDRDLTKMLTWYISDKEDEETGTFGLGFKTIYLVCKEPQILSDNLCFAIKSGLVPSNASKEIKSDLIKQRTNYKLPNNSTVIYLPLEQRSTQPILQDFQKIAPILIVFSREIKTCQVIKDQAKSFFQWNNSPFLGLSGIEAQSGQRIINKSNSTLLCFSTNKGKLLLGFTIEQGKLISCFPHEDIPTLWVTAPTQHHLPVGFLINGDFELTTGRESLVKRSPENKKIANEIGTKVSQALGQLLEKTESSWERVSKQLNLSEVDRYAFWEFIWQQLGVSWQNLTESHEGWEIISSILGRDRALGSLIIQHQALPNGLPKHYRQLVALKSVKYRVTGQLAQAKCFEKVAEWSHFRKSYPPNRVIASKYWEQAHPLLATMITPPQELKLLDALKSQLGRSYPKVNSQQAELIANLISKEFLEGLQSHYISEYNEICQFLKQIQFASDTGEYSPCPTLLCNHSDITEEEKRLVSFAPLQRRLASSYSEIACKFFLVCRKSRNAIEVSELVDWVLSAETEQQRQGVYDYLRFGEKANQLAVLLNKYYQQYWLKDDKKILRLLEKTLDLENEKRNPDTNQDHSIAKETNLSDSDEIVEEFDNDYYDPTTPIALTYCKNDFSQNQSSEAYSEFRDTLLKGLARQSSSWKGYIYHVTHVENAASILKEHRIRSRQGCPHFKDSAGSKLIGRTSPNIKNFARFYFRPKTPTQWHNEGLGKRSNGINALCPVPIFFRLNLEAILSTHTQCAVSNGNLASQNSCYGNSQQFLEDFFDFNNVYCSRNSGIEKIKQAAQQEFIIRNFLDLTRLELEHINVICRTEEDQQTLMSFVGNDCKYYNQISVDKNLYFNDNPYFKVEKNNQGLKGYIENYNEDNLSNARLLIEIKGKEFSDSIVLSEFDNLFDIKVNETIKFVAKQSLYCKSNELFIINIFFLENNTKWLLYSNESQIY